MKVVFDTNMILDAAMGRPGSEPAQELVQAAISGEIVGIVTTNSITDIHYIVKKRLVEEKARIVIYNVLSLFDVAAVDADMCSAALNTDMKDYEDAVLAVCAKRTGADYIATRDEGFINEPATPVTALHPQDILGVIRDEDD